MSIHKIGTPLRFFFLILSTAILVGVWLTGFTTAHWLLPAVAGFLIFAAVTGICPGMIVSTKLFGKS